MKEVFYNKEKAEKEKKEQQKKVLQNEKKAEYLEGLNNNENFKKYVLDEIIKEEIRMNENISGELANLVSADPETVKSLIVAKSGGLSSAKNIYNKIVNY
jgi:acetyl-CoA carboxylase carboxyltransferase component